MPNLLQQVQMDQQAPLLVCSPEYYHWVGCFWIVESAGSIDAGRSVAGRSARQGVAFYQGQVEQRRWYGFWDFGDVMHTYDTPRHEWKYDVGGFAWDDTELAPNLWLWYSFLRTGRADIYRMAEALTRQSQESDVYHIGPWKGLGSRHNVRHWGDGAKELRISQSLFKRFYYYLTTDERTGDLMNEEIDADKALLVVDPLRELPGIAQDKKYPTHVRIGPDWFALVSNWYTAWERTGDPQYLARIRSGMDSITAMPNKIMSGENFGYDPETRTLHQLTNDQRTPSLLPLFGGPELNFEIIPGDRRSGVEGGVGGVLREQRPAGAVQCTAVGVRGLCQQEPASKARGAWQQFLRPPPIGGPVRFDSHPVSGPDVAEPIDEIRNVSTNEHRAMVLNAIELLQLARQSDAGESGDSRRIDCETRMPCETGQSLAFSAVWLFSSSSSATSAGRGEVRLQVQLWLRAMRRLDIVQRFAGRGLHARIRVMDLSRAERSSRWIAGRAGLSPAIKPFYFSVALAGGELQCSL